MGGFSLFRSRNSDGNLFCGSKHARSFSSLYSAPAPGLQVIWKGWMWAAPRKVTGGVTTEEDSNGEH